MLMKSAHAKTGRGTCGAGVLKIEKTLRIEQDDESDEDALPNLVALIERAEEAATLLKALGHDGRLTILCHLRTGPKSVTELEDLLSARQAIVSQ